MAFENFKLLHGTNVEQAYSLISGGAGDVFTTWRPCECLYCIFVVVASLISRGEDRLFNKRLTVLKDKSPFLDPRT